MNRYGLTEENRSSVQTLFDSIDSSEITVELKKRLQLYADDCMDKVTDYFGDEYVIRFEDIALNQAKQIVDDLLLGKGLDAQGLVIRNVNGKEFVLDQKRIGQSLIDRFGDEIMKARTFEMQQEINMLKDHMKMYRAR